MNKATDKQLFEHMRGDPAIDAASFALGFRAAEELTVGAGQWVHCSPALMNSGVSCKHTPRRACECRPENGGHDHFISHASAGCADGGKDSASDARDAALGAYVRRLHGMLGRQPEAFYDNIEAAIAEQTK